MPEPRWLEHEVAEAERERRSLILVDQLCFPREAVDELEPHSVVMHTVLDRTALGGADVARDPPAAEPRWEQVAVEQARATFVERCLGEPRVDEGRSGRRDVHLARSGHRDHESARPGMPTRRTTVTRRDEQLDRPVVGAIEQQAESVSGHQGLGRVVGRGDLLEAEPEALQELDGRVERIRRNQDCATWVVGVHDGTSSLPQGLRRRALSMPPTVGESGTAAIDRLDEGRLRAGEHLTPAGRKDVGLREEGQVETCCFSVPWRRPGAFDGGVELGSTATWYGRDGSLSQGAGVSSWTTRDIGRSPVRFMPSSSAFIGSGPFFDIAAMSSSVIALPAM